MRLNLPKKITFWASVGIASAGVIIYVVYMVAQYLFGTFIPWLHPASFVLVVAAFVLLCLGLTLKGL
jgi:hypothetical protein